MHIFEYFFYICVTVAKKEDFEKRIEKYQKHRAISPKFVIFKLLQNIVGIGVEPSRARYFEMTPQVLPIFARRGKAAFTG